MDKKRILIAEDEVAYRNILKMALTKEGYDVAVAINGQELLKLASIEKPALIVLDLVMPVKNGFEVLLDMKKDVYLKHIKVIALSNLGQEEDIAKAKKLGVDDYIIKSDETFYTVIQRIKNLIE